MTTIRKFPSLHLPTITIPNPLSTCISSPCGSPGAASATFGDLGLCSNPNLNIIESEDSEPMPSLTHTLAIAATSEQLVSPPQSPPLSPLPAGLAPFAPFSQSQPVQLERPASPVPLYSMLTSETCNARVREGDGVAMRGGVCSMSINEERGERGGSNEEICLFDEGEDETQADNDADLNTAERETSVDTSSDVSLASLDQSRASVSTRPTSLDCGDCNGHPELEAKADETKDGGEELSETGARLVTTIKDIDPTENFDQVRTQATNTDADTDRYAGPEDSLGLDPSPRTPVSDSRRPYLNAQFDANTASTVFVDIHSGERYTFGPATMDGRWPYAFKVCHCCYLKYRRIQELY